MKIYINNFNINVLPNIIKNLEDKLIHSKRYIQIYAIDGIYSIDDDKTINKVNCIDNDITIMKNYYDNYTLIIDNSYCEKELVHSFNPYHIYMQIKQCSFEITNKSNIKLIIEGPVVDDITNLHGFIPNDIYFELPSDTDINDQLIKNEINGFLSELN
jgi:hypothetical protein